MGCGRNEEPLPFCARGPADWLVQLGCGWSLGQGPLTIERWVWSLQNDSVVAGGGAIEMELSKYLRDYSRTIPGKQQLLIGAYAKALEIIPRQLCDNAGFDATNILNKLRARHAQVGPSPWAPGIGCVGLNFECVLGPSDRAGTEPGAS